MSTCQCLGDMRCDHCKNLEAVNAELRLKLDCELAVREMTVARLGGKVEGRKTGTHNFLQRVDELREIEGAYAELKAENERLRNVREWREQRLGGVIAEVERLTRERDGFESLYHEVKEEIGRLKTPEGKADYFHAWQSEKTDHAKTLDAAEKAADMMDELRNALLVATAEVERLTKERDALKSLVIERLTGGWGHAYCCPCDRCAELTAILTESQAPESPVSTDSVGGKNNA